MAKQNGQLLVDERIPRVEGAVQGDRGNGESDVPVDEQGISNRPGDEDVDDEEDDEDDEEADNRDEVDEDE